MNAPLMRPPQTTTKTHISPAYLPPANLLYRILGVQTIPGESAAIMSIDARGLRWLITTMLENIDVDESWYLENNPDVAAAIMAGEVVSCREHFIRAGYFEGRLPGPPPCDEAWYLSQNTDVAAAVRNGDIPNGKTHFVDTGWREGRAGIPEHQTIANHLLTSIGTNRH